MRVANKAALKNKFMAPVMANLAKLGASSAYAMAQNTAQGAPASKEEALRFIGNAELPIQGTPPTRTPLRKKRKTFAV